MVCCARVRQVAPAEGAAVEKGEESSMAPALDKKVRVGLIIPPPTPLLGRVLSCVLVCEAEVSRVVRVRAQVAGSGPVQFFVEIEGYGSQTVEKDLEEATKGALRKDLEEELGVPVVARRVRFGTGGAGKDLLEMGEGATLAACGVSKESTVVVEVAARGRISSSPSLRTSVPCICCGSFVSSASCSRPTRRRGSSR